MTNKRSGERQRALKSATAIFGQGAFSVDCVIRDVSKTGARLRVPTTVNIPDRFTLVDHHGRTRREVTVTWRKGDLIGVRFE